MARALVLMHLFEEWGIQVLLSFLLRVFHEGVELLVQLWRDWAIQFLVVLSFALQVTLLITAEIRRRKDSGVLRAVVWSAYLMADTTAIYALGHLAVTSRSPQHQLTAFWAPFLLLHLGGQDNITAYAIEDNQLWLRHFQALAVQVAAAAYVIYESSIIGSQTLLKYATFLMFIVGFLKYAERVWALKCASASINEPNQNYEEGQNTPVNFAGFWSVEGDKAKDTEDLLGRAHASFSIANKLLARPVVGYKARVLNRAAVRVELFAVGEMQLSLMHDLLYTKAEVMHTWYGLCIRIISSACTAAAFVLFHRSVLAAYSRVDVDVGVTYALLAGAIALETMSLMRTMFSSWVLSDMDLRREVPSDDPPSTPTHPLRLNLIWLWDCMKKQVRAMFFHVILCVRRLVLPARRNWWSDSMGQYNLFELYDHRKTSRTSRIARWMGKEDWWNTMVCSRQIPVLPKIKQLMVESFSTPGSGRLIYVYDPRGAEIYTIMGSRTKPMELEESILVWHIATHIYLRWYKADQEQANHEFLQVTEALSNYMLFLLVARPHMLPGNVTRSNYVRVCRDLGVTSDVSTERFVSLLQNFGTAQNNEENHNQTELPHEAACSNSTLREGCSLGAKLISQNDTLKLKCEESGRFVTHRLDLIASVWLRMLFDAGKRCGAYAHAKQLSNGGELVTVAALIKEHTEIYKMFNRITNMGQVHDINIGNSRVVNVLNFLNSS